MMADKSYYKKQTIRLSKNEYAQLKNQSALTGLKMEPYIRSLIMGEEIKPRPPNEYAGLLRELSALGNNLNQIARIANATLELTPVQLDECRSLFNKMWRLVKDTF